ncbi:hypothetical protein F2P56_001459 [Juglans regia]|uniref:Uncharacterized protein n=1 Tax=Juglans regia TaxID=51240 RepID=A0A834DAG9_JUGRE|nr:hypothetical protein F2P56_001459 [Juglans regia]
MNRSQLLDPEQQIKKGVGGREDNINGEIKGKDGSVTTYNPIHPPEDQQRIKGSTVLGGDNMERETRDRDPVPTTPIHAASSPTFPDQQQKPKGADLRQEEDDRKRKVGHVSSKEQPKSSDGLKEKPRIENIKTIKQHEPPKDEADHLSNSEIRPRKTIEHPVMHDKEDHSLKEQHRNNFLGRENSTEKNGNMYATSNSLNSSEGMNNIPVGVPIDKIGGKIEVEVKVSICCRCSIL